MARLDQATGQQGRQGRQRRRRKAARIGNPALSPDLIGPDIGQPINPPLGIAMIAADIDDTDGLGNPGQCRRRRAGRQRGEQDIQLRHGLGIEFLDHQIRQCAGQRRKMIPQATARTALARSIDQLKRRMTRNQAQRLATPETTDPDNTDT